MSMTVFSSADSLPPETLLADCAVSGGRLEDYLRNLRALETGPVCVRLSYMTMDFPLPCPTGGGIPLTRQEALKRSRGHTLHLSAALGTGCFTQWDGKSLHAILMDTPETILRKYRLLQQLEFTMVLAEDPEIRQLLDTKPRNG